MSEDNTEVNSEKPENSYYFEVSFKSRGLVMSQMTDVNELRTAFTEDFDRLYGPGNYSLDTLEPASPEKVAELEAQAEALREFIESDEVPTVN